MLLEEILDNLWLLIPTDLGSSASVGGGWKGKVFLLNSENSYPSGAPYFPGVSVIFCQNFQEMLEEKHFPLG